MNRKDWPDRDLRSWTAPDLEALALEIREVLHRRTGKPVEDSVIGEIVGRFNDDWPEGWTWTDEPLFGDGPTPQYPDEPGVEAKRFYDFRGWELEHEDGRQWTLWKVFGEWHRLDKELGEHEPDGDPSTAAAQ